MATYNGERYIRDQIESILLQTYPIYELIIQDDGSTDATPDICRAYMQRYPFIQFTVNERTLGFNLNFKSAAMKAKGDFVAFSDQDDVWFKDKIERQVAAIGDCDICFSAHLRGADREHAHLVSPQYSLEALLFGGFAGHTMLLRRSFVQTPDYWIEHIHYDWSLAICAQLQHGIVMVDEPLNWHRTNENSACSIEMKQRDIYSAAKPTWQPYLYGVRLYRRLQRKPNWKALYTYIYLHTEAPAFGRVHRMSGYMLSPGILPLLKLCATCLKHGDIIYPAKNVHGLMAKVRSFCYPLIFSYNNIQYDLK